MSVAFQTPAQPDRIDEVEQLRETVETQARVIRYLLSNYDALLKKVEREDHGGGGGGP